MLDRVERSCQFAEASCIARTYAYVRVTYKDSITGSKHALNHQSKIGKVVIFLLQISTHPSSVCGILYSLPFTLTQLIQQVLNVFHSKLTDEIGVFLTW